MKLFRASQAEKRIREGYSASYLADVLLQDAVDSLGFMVVRIERGGKTTPHLHRELREVFIALTPLTMSVDSNTLSVEPYDIIIAEPGESHTFEAPADQDAHILAIKAPNLKEDKVPIT